MIIGIDCDGSFVEHRYPYMGKDVPYAAQVLKMITNAGHKLILHTLRYHYITDVSKNSHPEGIQILSPLHRLDPLSDAIQWFHEKDIPLYNVNFNPGQSHWNQSPKIYCHKYIDDNNVGTPLIRFSDKKISPYIDWIEMHKLLILEGILPEDSILIK